MTQVVFIFHNPDGTPRADTPFVVTLRRAGLNDEDNAVVLPDTYHLTTDADGQFIIDLQPVTSPYKVLAEPEDELITCSNGGVFTFYVPASDTPVYVQDLILLPPPSDVPWDEEQMNKIAQAVVDTKASADAAAISETNAAASADRAEAAAQGVEDYAAAAELSAQHAATSETNAANSASAAATSATNSANSATASAGSASAAAQSAADALASKNAAAGSATAAAGSASAADASKTAAATSATNAANSATAAGTSATNAGNSATAAAGSATAANTSATNAATSAGTATSEANRAQTEANRAQGYADTINPSQYATIASPTFTGDPKAPTPAKADNDTSIATTAHVKLVVADYAPLASPGLTGIPTAPTAALGTNTTQLATTAHVQLAMAGYGIGSIIAQPNWPNTDLANCDNVKSGIYRTIATTTGIPAVTPAINTTIVIEFYIRSYDGTNFQAMQRLTYTVTNRVFERVCYNGGSPAAPVWTDWREVAFLDSPTFTGTVNAATFIASGRITGRNGLDLFPASGNNATLTLFNAADTANAGYLQIGVQAGMNYIAASQTGTGVARELNINTLAGTMLRVTQDGITEFPDTQRIRGNWSAAAVNTRACLQTTVANSNTAIPLIPNGSATAAGIHMYGSSDPTNTSLLSLYVNSAGNNVLATTNAGSGTIRNLDVYYGTSARLSINVDAVALTDSTNFTFSGHQNVGSFASSTWFRGPRGASQSMLRMQPAVGASSTQNVGLQLWNSADANLENSQRFDIYVGSAGDCYLNANRTGSTVSYGNMYLSVAAQNRMMLDTSGNIVLGSNRTAGQIYSGSMAGTYFSGGGGSWTSFLGGETHTISRATDGAAFSFARGIGVGVGSIYTNATATAYNTTSDYRAKTNVREMPDCRAYIKETRPVLHDWMYEEVDNSLPTAGFIAHELQEVFPQVVTGVKDAKDEEGNNILQGVDYGKLTPYLMAATKSLIIENEEQAEQIATLAEENRVLKLQVAAILEHLNLTVDTSPPAEVTE